MKMSNRWRPYGSFELKLMKEIQQTAAVQQKLYLFFEKSVVIPPVESTIDRLSEQAYEPIVTQIQNITRFHSGHILAEKVFNQMSDEGVWSLVEHMLMNKTHHAALNKLHHSFDQQYWMGRLSVVKRSCPVWDVIAIPEQVGLMQFGQLLLRRRNILKRKSPVNKFELEWGLDNNLFTIGNRYVSGETGSDEYGIWEMNSDRSVSQLISSANPLPVNGKYELAEPFLIMVDENKISAAFLPDFPNYTFAHYQVDACPDKTISIERPSRGNLAPENFKDATTRFYPFIMEEKSDSISVFTFQLLKICSIDGRVSIKLAWSWNVFEGPNKPTRPPGRRPFTGTPRRQFIGGTGSILHFGVDREYAVFIRAHKNLEFENNGKFTISLVHLESQTINSIVVPFRVHNIKVVDGSVFVVKTMKNSDKIGIVKINFATSAKGKKLEYIYICELHSLQFSRAFGAIGDFKLNACRFVGHNLFYDVKSDKFGPNPNPRRMFLDRNITSYFEERITVYPKHDQRFNDFDLPTTGSSLIDVFQNLGDTTWIYLYMDDPTLLLLEIEQCMASTVTKPRSLSTQS